MPNQKFTTKQDRMAHHIMQSEMKRGMSPKRAKQVGYATVVSRQKSSPSKSSRAGRAVRRAKMRGKG